MASSNEFLSGLPVPQKEKIFRYGLWAGIGMLGVAGILKGMPLVNQAINLLLSGALSLFQLGLTVTALLATGFVVMEFAPAFQKLVQSLARQATWAIFKYDPVTPMILWLKKLRENSRVIEENATNVGSVIRTNDGKVSNLREQAEETRKEFEYAIESEGEGSENAIIASNKIRQLNASANDIEGMTADLKELHDLIQEIASVMRINLREAEGEVEAARLRWDTANATHAAADAANQVINLNGEVAQDARESMRIIYEKYSMGFAKMDNLMRLTQDIRSKAKMQRGISYKEALTNLRAQKQQLIGYSPTVPGPAITLKPQPIPVEAKGDDPLRLFDKQK